MCLMRQGRYNCAASQPLEHIFVIALHYLFFIFRAILKPTTLKGTSGWFMKDKAISVSTVRKPIQPLRS